MPRAAETPRTGISALLHQSKVTNMFCSRTSARAIAAIAAIATFSSFSAAQAASPDGPKQRLAHELAHRSAHAAVSPASAAKRLANALAARRTAVVVLHARTAHQVGRVAAAARADGLTVRHVIPQLRAVTVDVARPNLGTRARQLAHLPGVSGLELGQYRVPSSVPNDPDYPLQSSYLNAVNAPAAWDRETGSSAVRIAIVDTGVDVAHPDLVGKIAGTYNAVDDSTNVTDDDGHGTFVAGIAAAATDNGVGVAGAGYDTDLLAVKVAESSGIVTTDDEAAGIIWAADHGARIINVSLAGSAPSEVEQDAVSYAQAHGSLVIGAAGNAGGSTPSYPAAYPNVVAVGATDGAGRASFSDYGSWVTLAAPGVAIHSTTPVAGSVLFGAGTTGYGTADGTSFAAPIVAGAAALVLATDPSLSATQLRSILVASSSGYAGLGLGAGQINFATALDHVPPTTQPTSITPDGTANRITFTATSSAAEVAFQINDRDYSAPVPVIDGEATYTLASWGMPNGISTVNAVDCTVEGVCSGEPFATSFEVDNTQPVITAPHSGASITGGFTITATSSGGGVRFLVDGTVRGFDATYPYSFKYTGSALSEGRHILQLRQCSADQQHCLGPMSGTVWLMSNSLHPSIKSASPYVFSPNGDGVKDTTAVTYNLPSSQHVTISVFTPGGTRMRGPIDYGTQSGSRVWTWKGKNNSDQYVPNGAYRIEIDTSASINGATVRGMVSTSVRVDTVAPHMLSITGGGTTFYPYPDHYRDSFTPTATLDEDGGMTMVIKNSKNQVIQTINVYHRHRGHNGITWYGKKSDGSKVLPGTFSWYFIARDAYGNHRQSSLYHVYVSGKKLVTKQAVIRHNGDSGFGSGGSDTCASATTADSWYDHGIYLLNTCGMWGEYDQVAATFFKFTVPSAVAYTHLYLRISGNVFYSPSEMFAGFLRVDNGSFDVPRFTTLHNQGDYEFQLSSASGANHVNSSHATTIGVAVDADAADTSDFDLQWVQLTVDYQVLQ